MGLIVIIEDICKLCSVWELNKRLDCKWRSKGSIYIHEEGIDNKIRKEQLTESSTESVVESVARVGERVKVSESLSESRVGSSEHQ